MINFIIFKLLVYLRNYQLIVLLEENWNPKTGNPSNARLQHLPTDQIKTGWNLLFNEQHNHLLQNIFLYHFVSNLDY